MKNKLIALAIAAVAAVGMIACAPTAPTHGTVISKRYIPASTSTTQGCTSTTRKKQTTRTCRPVRSTTSARYELYIRDGSHSGYVSVSSFTYSRYHIGQRYP